MPSINRCSARIAPVVVAGCLALAPAAALSAQALAIEVPPSLILPNYNRVAIGQREGLEGGAFVARTDDAVANWYNPAGLARAKVTAINASANAYEWTSLALEGLGASSRRVRFVSIGTLFAAVLAEPVISSDKFRVGFSLARPVAWQPSRIDALFNVATSADPETRVSYSADVELSQYVPGLAIGWAPGGREGHLRFGAGLDGSYTTLSMDMSVSARAFTSTSTALSERRFVADGSIGHMFVDAGAQWDATSRITLGASFAAPGLRLFGSSQIAYKGTSTTPTTLADLTLADDEASFEYKLPLAMSAGLSIRLDRGVAEVDVRYRGAAGPYALFSSEVAGELVQSGAGTPPSTSTVPFATSIYEARAVTDVAVGGNYALSGIVRVHVGFATDRSPVADQAQSAFRQVHLWHATTGMSVTSRRLSGSLGLGYSSGEGARASFGGTEASANIPTRLHVGTLSVLYALTFGF